MQKKTSLKKGVSNLFTFKIPGFDWFDIGYTSFFFLHQLFSFMKMIGVPFPHIRVVCCTTGMMCEHGTLFSLMHQLLSFVKNVR
jgi:hypothetical protein